MVAQCVHGAVSARLDASGRMLLGGRELNDLLCACYH